MGTGHVVHRPLGEDALEPALHHAPRPHPQQGPGQALTAVLWREDHVAVGDDGIGRTSPGVGSEVGVANHAVGGEKLGDDGVPLVDVATNEELARRQLVKAVARNGR